MVHDTPLVKRAYNLGLKVAPNFLTLSARQIEYYEQHLDQIPAALNHGFIIPLDRYFTIVTTLDVVVPANYDPATHLSTFRQEHEKNYKICRDITDANFSKVTTPLTPGRKFKVKVIAETFPGTTNSTERMAFLRSHKAVFVGAQGASLVFAQAREQLPKGYFYASFDEKEGLFQLDGYRVVDVWACAHSDFIFNLGYFEHDFHDPYTRRLLCFCDE